MYHILYQNYQYTVRRNKKNKRNHTTLYIILNEKY